MFRLRKHDPTASSPATVPDIPVPPPGPLLRDSLPDADFVRYAYNFVLDREPDEPAWVHYRQNLADGHLTRATMIDEMRWSSEYRFAMAPRNMLLSLHHSRCDFVRSFPRARRILDLGGTAQHDPSGAMIVMGYPYRFDELIIVDLPHDDRHDIYTHSAPITEHPHHQGMVRYRYHSMVDLSQYEDNSFDLVYSGQTIEHVSPDDCDTVLNGVFRVLKPGGWFMVDTPNGPVCRMQQDEFINPDHEVEYGHEEFVAKLIAAKFNVRIEQGLNWCGPSIDAGAFSVANAAWNRGVYGTPAECYLLAYGAQKPE